MQIKEIIKKYGENKEHLENVSRLSLLFFNKIKPYFKEIQKYDNKRDLNLLKQGAVLHDIGIKFENVYNLPHNKAGARFIFDNKPDETDEEDIDILACLIRYHRKSFPKSEHPFYKDLDDEQKAKVNYLAAVIRIADALDSFHMGFIYDFEVSYDENALTLLLPENIMLNERFISAIDKKKDFFEAVYKIKLKVKKC